MAGFETEDEEDIFDAIPLSKSLRDDSDPRRLFLEPHGVLGKR